MAKALNGLSLVLFFLPFVSLLLWLLLKLRKITPSFSFIEISLTLYSVAAFVLYFLTFTACEGATGSRQLNVYSALAESVFAIRVIVALWLTVFFPIAVYLLVRACSALMDRRWLAGLDLTLVLVIYGIAISTGGRWFPSF